MSADCLFCKIAAKKIPSKIVYEDPDVFAFEDISPQAPTHVLICPRKHFESLTDAAPEDQAILGKLQLVAAQLARERHLLEGYRTVLNKRPLSGGSHVLAVPRFWLLCVFCNLALLCVLRSFFSGPATDGGRKSADGGAHLFAAELERAADAGACVDSGWKGAQLFRNERLRKRRQDRTLGNGRGVRGTPASG